MGDTANPPQPMKIIDLSDDCLRKIFEYLDFENLFNVAISNEWLRPAANDLVKRKYGNYPVRISGFDLHPIFTQNQMSYECTEIIDVIGLKSCLQYLRCFGSSITKLSIQHIKCYNEWRTKRCHHVYQHIKKYCNGSSLELTFIDMPNILFGLCKQPMKNVVSVGLVNCDLKKLLLFDEWFPNMRRSNLSGELTNYKFISGGNQKAMEINEIVNLLKSCQQLQTLQIDVLRLPSKLAFNSLLNMIKHNRMISKLNFKSESIPLFKVDTIFYDLLMNIRFWLNWSCCME